LIDFTLGIYSISGRDGILSGLDFHQLMASPGADLQGLQFVVYEPATHQFHGLTWAQLPEQTRVMLQHFYGNGAELLYRYHPNVGTRPRTFMVRAMNRLFDLEEMMVLAPNSQTLAAVTWYGVHTYSRRIFLCTLVILPLMGLIVWQSERQSRRGSRPSAQRTRARSTQVPSFGIPTLNPRDVKKESQDRHPVNG
jgi:hypothetical protein